MFLNILNQEFLTCNNLIQDNDPVSTAPNYRFDEKNIINYILYMTKKILIICDEYTLDINDNIQNKCKKSIFTK